MASSNLERRTQTLVLLEQLRDLYERIPFARGRERIALLHRLRSVTTEVRKARASSGFGASMTMARAVGTARGLAADTARR